MMADKPEDTSVPNPTPQPGGFPLDTALADMTAEQQVAYWKQMARKHEDAEKSLRGEVDRLKPMEAEFEKQRQAQMSEAEKALDVARAEAKREGAVAWQRVAVEEAVIGAAKAAGRYSTDEDKDSVAALLSMIDPAALITSDGQLDRGRVEKALAPVKSEGPTVRPDVAKVERQRKPGPGAGSVEAVRQAFLDQHKTQLARKES